MTEFSTVYLEDGTKAEYYKSYTRDNSNVLLWTSDGYNFILQIENMPAGWDDAEVLRIASGVKRED